LIVFHVCSEYDDKRREWLLHEAELFAQELLTKWQLGHCDEDVVVLYSLQDGVVSAAARVSFAPCKK